MGNLRKLFFTLFIFFAVSTSAFADIREVQSMKEALAIVTTGDVVVFDIDNTISEPAQTLGSDQWYSYLVDKYKKSGLSEDQAIDQAIQEWIEVQLFTKARPVEAVTPGLIAGLQARNVMTIALTARPVELKDSTVDQLKSIDVNFQSYGLNFSDAIDVQLYKGVLFVGPKRNKGLVLEKFFEAVKVKPKRLIFVDDKVKHVKNMEEVFAKKGFANINFRYGAADATVAAFQSELADYQWSFFQDTGGLLSDEDARLFLK